jgi:SAM-dependent methyltransferase
LPLERYLRSAVAEYLSVDLERRSVDLNADMTRLPFRDGTFDLVFASHVLEHIQDDRLALSEVRRVLRRGGVAVLPVPVFAVETVEYPGPNPAEEGHVRCPGFDYYARYREYFSIVEEHTSDDCPQECQPFVYEDRTGWPTESMPLRPPMAGTRHRIVIPVCVV